MFEISYSLSQTKLKDDDQMRYIARVNPKALVEMEVIIEDAIQLGATGTPRELKHNLELFFQALINRLLMGYRVHTPVAIFGLVIKGLFNSITDAFDSVRHTIAPSAVPTKALREQIKDQPLVAKMENRTTDPRPVELTDFASQTVNQFLTPGQPARLEGYRLRFNAADPNQGIFFQNGGEPIRAEMVMDNRPGCLTFMVPASLTPGSYQVIVRAIPRKQRTLKVGLLPTEVTVNAV